MMPTEIREDHHQKMIVDSLRPTPNSEFTLRWHHHDSKLSETMLRAWESKLFLDVTLASGQKTIGCHKLVLCACSSLLETLLTSPSSWQTHHPHPMIYFNDIDPDDLVALVEFMYRGSLTVTHRTLPGIINAAQILKIRGLTRDVDDPLDSPPESSGTSTDETNRNRCQSEDAEEPEQPQGDCGIKKEEMAEDDEDSIHQQQIEAVNAAAFAMASAASANPSLSEEHKMQMANLITALARQAGANKQQQKQLATTSPSTNQTRQRLVWDPAHIVHLEHWYKQTRYPSLAESKIFADQLALVPHSADLSGRTRLSVTAQNVSHWFQNRRRKDSHPDIEEKRSKRGAANAGGKRKRTKTEPPLDLTRTHNSEQQQRDSDDEQLYIAESNQHHSDVDLIENC